jgi:predicted ATPase
MYLGSALALQGFYPEGIVKIEQGLQAFQVTGARMTLTSFLGYLTHAYLNNGQADEAQRVLDSAWEIVHKRDERYLEAELQRLRGELLLAQSQNIVSQENAAACFFDALDIARRQQTKSLELRAALSLSRLRQQQGYIWEARHLLAEVYSWFTEGFATADLQEAKALLDELA